MADTMWSKNKTTAR